LSSARAFAPASVGNACVGFDILGIALSGAGDEVEVTLRTDTTEIRITEITGVVANLPKEARANTTGAALLAMHEDLNLTYGLDVKIHKGIPFGSGMGGSAASAVAAAVAGAAIYKAVTKKTLPLEKQFAYALEGERVAVGAAHPDNVAPCLYGGLTLSSPLFTKPVHKVPMPSGLFCVLVHPNVEVETKHARQILRPEVRMQVYVHQTALLAGFVLGSATKNTDLMAESFRDLLIEPQRQHLIPAFDKAKAAACAVSGCLGFSISGSGPSVFALARSANVAKKLALEIKNQFSLADVESQAYISSLPAKGAHLITKKNK
jgi:homoserine kinase